MTFKVVQQLAADWAHPAYELARAALELVEQHSPAAHASIEATCLVTLEGFLEDIERLDRNIERVTAEYRRHLAVMRDRRRTFSC